MASSPRQRRKLRLWRRSRNQSTAPGRVPWRWMGLTGLLYAAAGTVMSAFPAPYWIWNLALGGAIAQSLALAGPKALRRARWWKANLLVLLAIIGAGLLGIAVAIALGFAGTDNLDDIEVQATAFAVILLGFLALLITASAAVMTAETGDRLIYSFSRLQTTLVLAATCIMGLGLGALIGLLMGE